MFPNTVTSVLTIYDLKVYSPSQKITITGISKFAYKQIMIPINLNFCEGQYVTYSFHNYDHFV